MYFNLIAEGKVLTKTLSKRTSTNKIDTVDLLHSLFAVKAMLNFIGWQVG